MTYTTFHFEVPEKKNIYWKAYTAQERFDLRHAGDCNGSPCEVWILRLGSKESNAPQVAIVDNRNLAATLTHLAYMVGSSQWCTSWKRAGLQHSLN